MSRLLMMGPPGAGKGTQATPLSKVLGVPAISTGDIFREQVRIQSALGLTVAAILAAGDYVPDDITSAVVQERLREPDAAHGFILDGYPRTLAQVDDLDSALSQVNAKLDAILHLDTNQGELVARLHKRAADGNRSDDTIDVIRHRIDVYAAQTAPLLEAYEARGLLVKVDGFASVEIVSERLRSALSSRAGLPDRPQIS